MELRAVGIHEVDLIERLFQKIYGKEKGIDYWKWCFQNPYGYINIGLFENNRLIGYYAAHFTKNSACMILPMTHPYYDIDCVNLHLTHLNYNIETIIKELSEDLHDRISTNRSFVYIFSNEQMKAILLEEGFTEAYQIKEYRIPIEKCIDVPTPNLNEEYTDYIIWRYRNHPLIEYIFQPEGIYSFYEDRIQIVEYKILRDLDEINLEKAIEMGQYLGYWNNKKYISFWSEIEIDYPFVYLPIWKQYKIFNDNLTIEDVLSIDKLRMGMNYNY